MRTLCDVCEAAAAIFFCAADEAALCRACDEKVHLCNKLASRHIRVGLADPSAIPNCDICENAPAFFYCEVDGSSLCLQCDMVVHVGGKKMHRRYLLSRQRIEFPGGSSGSSGQDMSLNEVDRGEVRKDVNHTVNGVGKDRERNRVESQVPSTDAIAVVAAPPVTDKNIFDLNARPQRVAGESTNYQEMEVSNENNHDHANMAPTACFKGRR